jgi:hypothetical protein
LNGFKLNEFDCNDDDTEKKGREKFTCWKMAKEREIAHTLCCSYSLQFVNNYEGCPSSQLLGRIESQFTHRRAIARELLQHICVDMFSELLFVSFPAAATANRTKTHAQK